DSDSGTNEFPFNSTQIAPGKDAAEAHAHYATAIVYEADDQPELALQEYYLAALKDPDNEPLVLEISRRFIQAKKLESALEILLKASERKDASSAVFARLGVVYFQSGKPDLAISANRTAIKRDPQSLIGYQNLFLIYLQKKQPKDALA